MKFSTTGIEKLNFWKQKISLLETKPRLFWVKNIFWSQIIESKILSIFEMAF